MPPSARSKRPLRLLVGPGERALLVAVELALDELRREERAADLDVGKPVAVRVAMDDAGQQVLAHARLAAQQHVGVGAAQISTMRLTRSMAADWPMIPRSTSAGAAAGSAAVSAAACRCRSIRASSGKTSSLRNGLVTKSKAPSSHRLDGHGNAAVGGHHDDLHRRPADLA